VRWPAHLLTVAAFAATPALAQETPVPPEVDRVLWCASAFYWLAGSAEDSGDQTEAEMYDRWSQSLLDRAGVSLTARAFPPSRIEELVAEYDERVLAELGSAEPPYDVATCPTLLQS
jgi:hypothetical protein